MKHLPLIIQTLMTFLILLLFAWMLDFEGNVRTLTSQLDIFGNSEENALQRKMDISSKQEAPASDPSIYLEAKPKIMVYDFEAQDFKFFKSIHHIGFGSFVDTKESGLVAAKQQIKDEVDGFLIFTKPLRSPTNEKEVSFRLKLWIGINQNELIRLLGMFHYSKVDNVVDESVPSQKDWLIFVQPGIRFTKVDNETGRSQRVAVK